jgi:hypothetical protein
MNSCEPAWNRCASARVSPMGLTRDEVVAEMLDRVPEAWSAYAEEEGRWMTDAHKLDDYGPHMLIGLIETVLCSRLLLPMLNTDQAAALPVFHRVNSFCDALLASDDVHVQYVATGGVLESMAIGHFDAAFVLEHIAGASREVVIDIRRANGHV